MDTYSNVILSLMFIQQRSIIQPENDELLEQI